jgi:hypothetical protein|tara:strand:- start:51 stop:197 length:147 start_codon:yes stop_codon:yes gene_type:complete
MKKKKKKGKKKDYIFVDNEWGDFIIFGIIFAAMIQFGYPYLRSIFGIE